MAVISRTCTREIATSAGIFLSLLCILGSYYFLYFVDFNEGMAYGQHPLSHAKYVGVMMLGPLLLLPKLRLNFNPIQLTILFFYAWAFILYTVKTAIYGVGDLMFLNTIIFGAPFLILQPHPNSQRIKRVLEFSVAIVAGQIIFDTLIFATGKSLWENKAFVGGLGNPSTFGLVCNLLVAYVLFARKKSISSTLLYILMSYGVLMSNSLLSFLSLVMVSVFWAYSERSLPKLGLVIAYLSAILIVRDSFVASHLLIKFQSAGNFLLNKAEIPSISVSSRLQMHKDYLAFFVNNPVQALLYGFEDIPYKSYDSQILTYAASFGLMATLPFLAATGLALLYSFSLNKNPGRFISAALLLWAISFLTNRLLDYFPLPLFFFFLIATIRKPSNTETRHLASH